MIDGMASRPFSATTLPPYPKEEKSCRETVIKLSRERYATPRDEVEMKIASWAGYGSKTLESEAIQKGKELHEAVCANCGGKALLPFKPDNRRPVYCDGCLEKIRSGELPPIPKGNHKSEVGPSPTSLGLEKKAVIEEIKITERKEIDSAKKDKPEDIKKTDSRLTSPELEKSEEKKIRETKPEPDKNALKEALQNILKQRDL